MESDLDLHDALFDYLIKFWHLLLIGSITGIAKFSMCSTELKSSEEEK